MEFRLQNYARQWVQPHRLIKILAFLFSITIVYVLSVSGPLVFPAYSLKERSLMYTNKPMNRTQNFFHDFDHDGASEFLQLKFNSAIYQAIESGIKIYNSNDGIIDQWNFLEPWVPQKLIFGDADQDGFDEVYIFTLKDDSLFLYGIDPRQRLRFKLFRKFLLRGPRSNPNPKRVWDIYRIEGFMLDGDKDGYPDIYFNLRAGFSLQPRQMFAYSIHKDSLWASPVSGAIVSLSGLVYPPEVGSEPIIYFGNSNSPGNFHKPFPYTDQSAWFMVLTPQLSFLFPPIEYKHFGSSVFTIPVKWNEQFYFLNLRIYIGELNIHPRLLLYNLNGQLIREKMLPSFYEEERINWRLCDYSMHHVLLYNDLGEIYEISPNLELMLIRRIKPKGESKKFPVGLYPLDVDLDGDKEIVAMTLGRFYIFDKHLKQLSKFDLSFDYYPGIFIGTQLRGHRPPGFLFEYTGKGQKIFYFDPNPNVNLAVPVRLGVFALTYLLTYYILLFVYQGLFYIYLLNTLFRRHPNGICIVYDNQQVAWMNSNFIHYFGLPGLQRSYASFREEFVHVPQLVQFIQKLFDVDQPLAEDITISLDSKRALRGKIKGLPIKGKTGISMGYMIEYVDRESPEIIDRWRIWSSTMKKLAHDIKTPLSTILLNIQTIQYKVKELVPQVYPALESDLELVRNEIKRVREITKNFLKFSNLESPNFQRISLRYILDNTLRHFQKYMEGDLDIRLEVDEDVETIWADPQQMEMVFQILLENAIDAIKGKGIVLISASRVQYPEENFRDYIEIDIADSGRGIPEDIRDKIFEPYFTTKKEGTGLGLAIARKIVEDHGGKIEISARDGFPTVIKIVLPFQEDLTNGTDSGD